MSLGLRHIARRPAPDNRGLDPPPFPMARAPAPDRERPDPIVAVATAAGRGAVGVVRVSSPEPLQPLIEALCERTLEPRRAHRVRVRDARGEVLDEGLALYFPAPHSFTGESVLELQGHGGPALLQLLVERCLEAAREPDPNGRPRLARLRLARPGEFSERAFHNGKMDLVQAEAVADLIEADSAAAARGAARSLAGEFSREVHALAQGLEQLRLLVEASLDFPEEDIDFVREHEVAARIDALVGQLDALRGRAQQGLLLREGLQVVLAGVPNAGKSSLLNALAGEELAIVTPVAGTTRDRVRQTVVVDGVALHLTDTAGLRATDDEVERIGVQRSWQAIAQADVVVWVHDLERADDPGVHAAERQIAHELLPMLAARPATRLLHVFNKCDGLDAAVRQRGVAALAASLTAEAAPVDTAASDTAAPDTAPGAAPLCLSARSGEGLATLRRGLLQRAGWQSLTEGLFLARTRHVDALGRAHAQLASAAAQLAAARPALDLLAEDLRLAHRACGEITGEFTTEDLLGAIFGRFCIGK